MQELQFHLSAFLSLCRNKCCSCRCRQVVCSGHLWCGRAGDVWALGHCSSGMEVLHHYKKRIAAISKHSDGSSKLSEILSFLGTLRVLRKPLFQVTAAHFENIPVHIHRSCIYRSREVSEWRHWIYSCYVECKEIYLRFTDANSKKFAHGC